MILKHIKDMKTIINKLRYTLLALFALTALADGLNAQQVKIAKGGTVAQSKKTFQSLNAVSQVKAPMRAGEYTLLNDDIDGSKFSTDNDITVSAPWSATNVRNQSDHVLYIRANGSLAFTVPSGYSNANFKFAFKTSNSYYNGNFTFTPSTGTAQSVNTSAASTEYECEFTGLSSGDVVTITGIYTGYQYSPDFMYMYVYVSTGNVSTGNATICDGTETSSYLPIYGLYADEYQVNQMIYPESLLSAKGLVGKTLTSMTFYANAALDAKLAAGTWTVKLGTTNQTTFVATLSSNSRIEPTDVVAVVTGYHFTTGSPELTIYFSTPFTYNGGNLLIDFQETARTSDYNATTFYGITQTRAGFNSHSSNAALPSNGIYTGSYGGVRDFLPKVTFTYEDSEPITQGTVSPSAVSFGEVPVGQSATQTLTISNTGNQPFTPVIDATSLPAGVTVSTASQIAAGGNLPLTVTFAPTTEGAVSGSFTVTIPVPDEQGDDIVVTVNVTGSGYEISSTLTSQTVVVPVYKSDIQAPSRTYVFSREEVENDTLRTLSYSDGAKIQTQVLVKNEEPLVSYDLHRKAGSGNWTYPGGNAVAQAVQQSNPSTYVVGQETFTIPQDATQLWVPMTDEGVDASSELMYVPVTVADGVVTTGNTYGAPQVAATSDGLTITFEVTGSKSAGGVGGNWDQTLPDGTTENYCVYSPVITIKSVDPAFGINTRLPYMFRAWLLVDNSDIYYYDIKRVPNTNDPTHGHIVADSLITQPKLLGTLPGTPDMVGIGPFGPIGYEWTEGGELSPSGNVKPESVFGAPTDLGNREMKFAVRVYYYKPQAETPSGHMLRAAGDDTPEDGYAYADQDESESQDIQTAVSSIYGDREVVDVQYVNALGQQSSKPFEGVNIVVTRYSDGTMSTTKVLK